MILTCRGDTDLDFAGNGEKDLLLLEPHSHCMEAKPPDRHIQHLKHGPKLQRTI